MKKILLSLTLGLFLAIGVQAQTYVDEDFDGSAPALPTGWTSEPAGLWKTGVPDVIIPNARTMVKASLNAAGHSSVAGVNGNTNANNSMLVSPSFDIPSSVTEAYVKFDLAYLGVQYTKAPSYKESVSLHYTTDGGSSWSKIQDISANHPLWARRAISLSSLAGKNDIQLGIKYQNADTVLVGIGVDNFEVVVPPTNEMALLSVTPVQGELAAYGNVNDNVTISGTVENNGHATITSYTVYYQEGNDSPVSSQKTASIAPFTTGSFDLTYTIASSGAHSLKVWVELSGDTIPANDSGMAYIEVPTADPTKRILFEEGTGTWCGFCPRGSYNMKKFAKDHPGATSQVAVHNGVGSRFDPMAITAYDAKLRSLLGGKGFPNILVDRKVVDDPGNVARLYQMYKDEFAFADVVLQEPTFRGTQVAVSVNIKPAVEIKDAKLALIVTEDNVTGTGAGWAQVNYYAGGGSGPMGGYEKLPRSITNEVYEFVARSITPSPSGGASGLPSTMAEGQSYAATLNANLSSSWTKENLSYIVALIDSRGRVLNTDHFLATTGIDKKEIGLSNALIYPNPVANDAAFLSVTAENAMNGTISVMDLTGRTVSTIPSVNLEVGQNTIEVPTNSLANGIYMVSFKSEKGNLNLKFQVTK